MKSITPVISIIILILITVIASAAAYFFIDSNIFQLKASTNLDNYPGMDNSRVNIVSVSGNEAIIRNDGTDSVTDLVIFVNGELLNYTLAEPILPGELKTIIYTSRLAEQDLDLMLIYNRGKIEQVTSPASINTIHSGFTYIDLPLNYNPPVLIYETDFESGLGNWTNGSLAASPVHSGKNSLISDGAQPTLYFNLSNILNIELWFNIPAKPLEGNYTFLSYSNRIGDSPLDADFQELGFNATSDGENFYWNYYTTEIYPPENKTIIPNNISYGSWYKLQIDIENELIRFNKFNNESWNSIEVVFNAFNYLILGADYFNYDDLIVVYR